MSLSNFVGFSLKRVLNENADRKTVYLLGTFASRPGEAIILLEKQALSEKASQLFVDDESTKLGFVMQNDIYGVYTGVCDVRDVNELKVTVMYPATERLIQKFSAQETRMVRETAEDFQLITRPYLQETARDLKWVENILEKKAERDRVLCEDDDPVNGFVLLADMKWNQKQMEELYVLAICRQRGLASIRDLDGRHVTMLRNIRDKSLACLGDKYGLKPSQVRSFFHYQPSYYHLHIHFTHARLQQPGSVVGKAHLLDDVIDNITLIGESYYQKCALTFQLPSLHPLLTRLMAGHADIDDTPNKPVAS